MARLLVKSVLAVIVVVATVVSAGMLIAESSQQSVQSVTVVGTVTSVSPVSEIILDGKIRVQITSSTVLRLRVRCIHDLLGHTVVVQGEPRSGVLVASLISEMAAEVPCGNCGGTGKCKPPAYWIKLHPEDDRLVPCPICGGTGTLVEEVPNG